jgi:hypothetical protein
MGLVVAGVGLAGTAHVVNYLQLRLVDHGIEHNKEIAFALLPKIEAAVGKDTTNVLRILSRTIDDYRAFGFQIIVFDRRNKSIVVLTFRASGLELFLIFLVSIFSASRPKIAFRYIQVIQYSPVSVGKLVLEFFYDFSIFDNRIGRHRLENIDDLISGGTA